MATTKSFGIIMASEIGDKTFFIAAVMAMRSPRVTVFASAVAALAAMTVLSAAMGWAAPNLIPKKYTHYAATALFFFFGLKSLYDVLFKKEEEGEESELQQVEQELGKSSEKDLKEKENKPKKNILSSALSMVFSQIFIKCFTLTFLAEWGDRSQISTIGLAAQADPVGVTIGGILGHMVCTGAAVIGGRHLAQHINERTVAVFGGVLFIIFGVHALYTGPE
eukprot:gene22387-29494_t